MKQLIASATASSRFHVGHSSSNRGTCMVKDVEGKPVGGALEVGIIVWRCYGGWP